jgi:hypothetical protein
MYETMNYGLCICIDLLTYGCMESVSFVCVNVKSIVYCLSFLSILGVLCTADAGMGIPAGNNSPRGDGDGGEMLPASIHGDGDGDGFASTGSGMGE